MAKEEEKNHDLSAAYKSLKSFSKKLKKHSLITTESDPHARHDEHFDFAHALHPRGNHSSERHSSDRHSSELPISERGSIEKTPDARIFERRSGSNAESREPSLRTFSSHGAGSTHSESAFKVLNPLRLAHKGASEVGAAAKGVGSGVGNVAGAVGAAVTSGPRYSQNSQRPVNMGSGPRIADTLTLMSDNPEQRARAQRIEEAVRELNARKSVSTGDVSANVVAAATADTKAPASEHTGASSLGANPINPIQINQLGNTESHAHKEGEDVDIDIPNGSVPGLWYGDSDPLLPGQKPKAEAQAEAQSRHSEGSDGVNSKYQQSGQQVAVGGTGGATQQTLDDAQSSKEKREGTAGHKIPSVETTAAVSGSHAESAAAPSATAASSAAPKQSTNANASESPDVDQKLQEKRFKPASAVVSEHRALQAEYVGWRQVGGWDPKGYEASKDETSDVFTKSTILEGYISNKFIGDWYQNTAIILITAFCAWALGRLRFSITWVWLLLLFTATAYRTSVRRMRRNYRDDIIRETLIERSIEKDTETMEWLNSFLVKFWLIYEPSLSQMITTLGNETLAEQTPGFIDSMTIQKFTLGTKAPRIDSIRSFPHTKPNIVVIDMAASFTPNDTFDLTARQLQTKINPKAQLGVRIGKGFLTKNFPILLEDMNFKGHFRVRFKLMNRFPHFETMDFSFLQAPQFDFVLKPIGGDKFGFDINIIPGLSKFIKDTVNANLGPMLYAPNAFQVNIEQLLQNVGVLTGVGVLSVQIISAEKLVKSSDGRVDPYVVIKDKQLRVLQHTQIKANTADPVWDEYMSVIVTNTNDNFLLEVLDFNDNLSDRSIGQITLRIEDLYGSKKQRVQIMSGGRPAGFLTFVGHYSPVHMPSADDAASGRSPRDTKSGILNIKISRARYLDPRVNRTAKLSAFAEIEFNGRLVDSTKVTKNSNDPDWNYSAEHIVEDKLSTLFVLRVKDDRPRATSPTVGIFKMRMGQLLLENEKGNKWFSLEGKRGDVCIETQWKPCNIRTAGNTGNYVEPIGVVRLKIISATSLINLEHIGKIDPYTRVLLGNRLVTRTNWFHNNLNPVWNETQYIPVENELQEMKVEVMDVQRRGKDRSLGSFKIDLSKIIVQDAQGNYKITVSDRVFSNKLMLPNRGPKGTLQYTIEFYPAVQIISPQIRESIETDKKIIDILKKKIQESGGDIKKALTEKERTSLIAKEERMNLSGVDMPVEEQLKYSAGVFACAIVSLTGHRMGQSVRMVANNTSFPFFTSPVLRTSEPYSANECADFVSAQIDISSVRVEIGNFGSGEDMQYENIVADMNAEHEVIERDRYAGELTVPCRELIRDATLQPKTYTMANGAQVSLQVRFFPLPGLLFEPEEDISHCGTVEVNLVRAEGVRSADSNGFSDPYVAFYLDAQSDKIYKSKTIKETLNPVWNESFRFAIKNYKDCTLRAMVMDWDMGNKDDFLGGYQFDLSELEPLEWKEYNNIRLENIRKHRELRSHEVEGTLTLRIRFDPGHLQRKGDGFVLGPDSVARAAGGLVSSGANHAVGVAHAGIGAVDKGVSGAFSTPRKFVRKLKGHDQSAEEEAELEAAMSTFYVNINSITKFSGKAEIQIRCFLILDGEQEVWRSDSIEIDSEETPINERFEMRSLPEGQLGVKLLAMKTFGRHSDLGQSATDLNPGTKQIILQNGCQLNVDVEVQ